MSPKLIVLFGVSGVGKTSILRMLEDMQQIKSLPKYTTRPSRKTPDDERDFIFQKLDTWPMEELLRFESYGHHFGVQIENILKALDSGISTAVVLGDMFTIETIRKRVKNRLLVVFVFCEEQELMRRLECADSGARMSRMGDVKDEIASIYSQIGSVDIVVNNTRHIEDAVMKIVDFLGE